MHEHSTTWQVVTVGLTYVHGGVGCMHEQHKGRGGDGCSLLQATLAIQVYVNVEGGFQVLLCPLAPGLLCEAHLLGKDGHNLCASLCKKEKKSLRFSANITGAS